MEKIRVGLPHRGAGVAPMLAAIEGGYFRENGLETEIVPYHGHADTLAGLLAGEIDFTNSVAAELMMANHRKAGDAVIIASAISRSAQQVSARPGLTSREQLRGKRWGVTARNDADECSILMAFERWGWDMARDAEIVVVGGDGPRLDLLLDDSKVDVAIMHAPEPFQAVRRGWTLVEDLGRLDVAFQNSCAATTRRILSARPETVLAYVRAFCQSVYRFRTDAEFGIHVLRTHSEETDEEILEQTWVLFARLMGGMMFPSLEGIRNAGDVLHRLGALPAPVDSATVADMTLVATLEDEGFFPRIMAGRG